MRKLRPDLIASSEVIRSELRSAWFAADIQVLKCQLSNTERAEQVVKKLIVH